LAAVGLGLIDVNEDLCDMGIENVSNNFEWVAELIVEIDANSDELARVCETLRNRPDTVVLTVVPTKTGTKITCGILRPDSFLNSLSDIPELASWSFTPR
jgi:hypothetical protein